MFERIDFQGKMWRVIDKVEINRIDNPDTLKQSYHLCDMVIRNNKHFFILNEIIDVEFEGV